MSLYSKVLVRGGGDQERRLEVSPQGDLFVAHDLPSYTEITRKGESWATMATAAVAGLVVRPTTTAALEIFNNETSGGKSLVIDRLFSNNLVSTNVIESFQLYAMVTRPKAAPTDAALAITSLSGKAAGTRTVFTAASTTVVDNGWFPWGESFTKGAGGVVPHGGIVAEVNGRIIVPPQSSLCLHTLASLVGQTFTHGASWFFEQLTLG